MASPPSISQTSRPYVSKRVAQIIPNRYFQVAGFSLLTNISCMTVLFYQVELPRFSLAHMFLHQPHQPLLGPEIGLINRLIEEVEQGVSRDNDSRGFSK
jgi:hypothetical protein